jgi:hypothetical protein
MTAYNANAINLDLDGEIDQKENWTEMNNIFIYCL